MKFFALAMAFLVVQYAMGTETSRPTGRFLHRKRQRILQWNIVNFVVSSEVLAQSDRIFRSLRRMEVGLHDPMTNILLGINAAVFSAWYGTHLIQSDRGVDWMMSNFLLANDKSMRQTKPHTIVTSVFSHVDVGHFLSNMGVLRMFVPGVVRVLRYRRFAYFYASTLFDEAIFSRCAGTPSRLISRIAAFSNKYIERGVWRRGKEKLSGDDHEALIAELIDEVFEEESERGKVENKRDNRNPTHSLGASGVLSAVMIFRCLSLPHDGISVGGITLEAPLAALTWALSDLTLLSCTDGIGHGAHLGGTLFEAVVYAVNIAVCSRKKMLK